MDEAALAASISRMAHRLTQIATRTGDVSDATPSVVDAQLGYDIGPQSFDIINASLPVARVVAVCLDRIGATPEPR